MEEIVGFSKFLCRGEITLTHDDHLPSFTFYNPTENEKFEMDFKKNLLLCIAFIIILTCIQSQGNHETNHQNRSY